tara:strand:+ start:391 stop:528 length:138 start_codon:yes stop_codon:yes gene_type:complete
VEKLWKNAKKAALIRAAAPAAMVVVAMELEKVCSHTQAGQQNRQI